MTKGDAIDCEKCGGEGLVKMFWLRQWMVTQCDRCKGFGVEPSALSCNGAGGESAAGSKP